MQIVNNLAHQGIVKIFITIGYESNKCREHIKFIKKELNINLIVYEEKNQPLGESGALWEIKDHLLRLFYSKWRFDFFLLIFTRIINTQST